MKRKATLSGVLAAILLCVLSWTSVCDLSCQSPAVADHSCCADEASVPDRKVAVTQDSDCHDMNGMATPTMTKTAIGMLHSESMTCAKDGSVASIDAQEYSLDIAVAAMTVETAAVVLHKPRPLLRGDSLPPGAAGFRPLLVSLRV